ncbi:MAG: hypothetical protein ACJA1F_002702 [Paracoccaceae bacterium]|jgi:hypothetical protein
MYSGQAANLFEKIGSTSIAGGAVQNATNAEGIV